jgi:uncharacterized delta-60 repeat protein
MSDCIAVRHESRPTRRTAGMKSEFRSTQGRRPRYHPELEGLEGRALMSYGGSPDLTLGINGVKAIQISGQQSNFDNASVAQADGKTVVVGSSEEVSSGGLNESDWSVARFSPDGVLDSSFGNGGISTPGITFTYGSAGVVGYTSAEGVALQPDGKIIVVGNIYLGNDGMLTNGAGTLAKVVRLNADGTLDTTFGNNGIVTLGTVDANDNLLDYSRAVAVLSDGTIVVSGANEPVDGRDYPAVEGLNADGSIDTSFGRGGLAVVPLPTNAGSSFDPSLPGTAPLIAQPDGKVVVETDNYLAGSTTNTEIVVSRLDADGSLDPTFGTAGQAVVTAQSLLPFGVSTYAESLAIQPDGKLIVGGDFATSTIAYHEKFQLLALRFTSAGVLDPSFGIGGANILTGVTPNDSIAGAIALQPDGKIVLGDRENLDFVRLDTNGLPDNSFGTGGTSIITSPSNADANSGSVGLTIEPDGKILSTQAYLSQVLIRLLGQGATGDYDNDGVSDPAILITPQSIFAAGFSGGSSPGEITQFGTSVIGNTLPAPGAYDGAGISELAVYLPQLGAFAVRPYTGGPDVYTAFGTPGVGNSLPAPGDYDDSGRTEYAVYLPASGTFAYRPAGGGPDVFVALGLAGAGQSIPASADYFGTGQDDFAVYLPGQAAFEIRNPVTGQNVTIPFGMPGAGNSIPVPGDYDGSDRDELAVYLPSLAMLIYRPANGGPDVQVPFGIKGAGMTLPAPGDYDGSGHTEVAGYEPATGTFTYLPASGGPAVSELFGPAGGMTIPFSLGADAAIELGIVDGSGSLNALALTSPVLSASGSVEIPLTPDVLDSLAGPTAKKKAGQG